MAGKVILKSNLMNIAFKKESLYVIRNDNYSMISSKNFIEAVQRNSGLDAHIIQAASDAIAKEFQNLLLNGHAVTVPGLGIFRFALNAKAQNEQKDAGAAAVTRRKIIYRPSKDLKIGLSKISLEMAKLEEVKEEGGEGTGN